MERVRGVEPLSPDWQPGVMPLYDTRVWFPVYVFRRFESRVPIKKTPAPARGFWDFLVLSRNGARGGRMKQRRRMHRFPLDAGVIQGAVAVGEAFPLPGVFLFGHAMPSGKRDQAQEPVVHFRGLSCVVFGNGCIKYSICRLF